MINTENKKMDELSSKIVFSEDYLDIQVEEGEVYRGHLILESADHVTEIQGKIYSTNDKLVPEMESFQGVKVDIPFYFKGKLAVSGDYFSGDFVFITNMGEYNIPYHIDVVEAMMETSLGKTNRLRYFAAIYEKDRAEAARLFFMSNFSKVFLKNDETLRHLYKSLQKGRKRAYIVEEFLVSAGYKRPTAISVPSDKVVLGSGEESDGEITLFLENNGYIEGTIQALKGQVTSSVENFTADDFKDGVLTITVEAKEGQIIGSDVIRIVTPRQIFEIPVEWWGEVPAKSEEAEERHRINKHRIDLMNDYLAFRTGNINLEDFTQDALHILEELILKTDELEWKLYSIHVLMIQNRRGQAGELLDALEQENVGEADPLYYNYYLYLKALYSKSAEDINRAVLSIREQYVESAQKAEHLWMLLNLDREYVYNKRLQYDSIKELFNSGCSSSLLCFEACDILNDNPAFMDEVGNFEIRIFRWGMRYGYISMALAQQFTKSAQKVKFFKKSIFYTALKLYQVDKDDRFLTLICALLIKGNLIDQKYHSYFRAGVEKNLKLIGLNEFYIRSMDFNSYEIIPQRVLLHFTYSSSLDAKERAYLYVNVMKNKEHYEEVLGAYRGKIMPFVENQLIKGNVNEPVAYLYRSCLSQLLQKPEFFKPICDIIFQYNLECHNPNMIGVYVSCPETGQEKYYSLPNGKAKIEIYNDRTMLYFVNRYEQRFHTGIDYELKPFIDMHSIPQEWFNLNLNNDKVVLMQSVNVDDIEEETLYLAKKIYGDNRYEGWLKERAIESLLLYYSNHNDIENLKKWLERTDYFAITDQFREKLMRYYIATDMIENAFFGIELYGSQMLSPELRLKIAEFGIDHYHGEKEENTLALCYDGIVTKHYSDKTLLYLMDHFEGELVDYLMLWDRSRKSHLDTEKLEERILRQCIYTGTYSDGVAQIFENYYIDNKDSTLVIDYLQFVAGEDYTKEDLPYSLEKIIGREILGGRITSQRAKIHFLYYYSIFEDLQESESKVISFIIEGLLKDKVYLPIYYKYRSLVELPVDYRERTFLTYLGKEAQEVYFSYTLENDKEIHRIKLDEVIPGRYICSLHFFQTDRVTYTVKADGEKIADEKAYQFESFAYEKENSRFFLLNEISQSGYEVARLEDYVKRTTIAKDYVTLL